MPIHVPEQARCLKCGYLLRGLDEPVCPECSRAFDPKDPKTYITDPQKRRRRRLISLAIILLLIGGAGYALWPQQIMTAQMTFTMRDSGHKIIFRRWELLAPNWMPLTYPSFHWRSNTKGNSPPGVNEPFSFQVKAKFLWAMGDTYDGQVITVNGIIAHPDHANELMKALLATIKRGVRIGMQGNRSVTGGGTATGGSGSR